MKLSELKQYVDLYYRPGHEDPEVVIKIKLPYSTVGGTPTVKIKNVSMGFDWDRGKFIFRPEKPLCPEDRDFAKQMREMQERVGCADYENRALKSEIRKLKRTIKQGGGKYSDIVSDGGLDPRNQGNEK
jgi:hypothetical protein